MNSLLFKIVVLASTVGTILPTGWCCATSGESAPATHAQTLVTQRPCCQRRQMNRQTDCGSVPGKPNFRCCCQRDAALPVKRVQQSVAPAVVAPLVMSDLTLGPGSTFERAVLESSLGEGPPPYLLKCVWRC
jgi:hypothetical protein